MSLPPVFGTIRPFKITDLSRVETIARASFRERYTQDFFEGIWHVAPDTFLVMEVNGTVTGFILGMQTDIDKARILMLAVTMTHRRQGIGSLLLNMFLDRLKGRVKKVYLEVHTDNTGAIRFYTQHGFLVTESLNNFYTDGSDAFVMKKPIL